MASNDRLAALERAVATSQASRLRKLVHPGVRKYVVRTLARRRSTAVPMTASLFFDAEMSVVLPEVISEAVYLFGYFDEYVSFMAIESVASGDTVIDVGAHFGYFTLLFSHAVGDTGRVFSFEPTPSTFEVLSRNAQRRSNITPLQAAAGDVNGTCEIADYGLRLAAWNTTSATSRLSGDDVSAEPTIRTVPMQRLDDFVGEQGIAPNVVKIDAENSEDGVVRGMSETIRRYRPKIIMETGSKASLDAGRQILAHGYRPRGFRKFGELVDWSGDIAEANTAFKDILFVPQ